MEIAEVDLKARSCLGKHTTVGIVLVILTLSPFYVHSGDELQSSNIEVTRISKAPSDLMDFFGRHVSLSGNTLIVSRDTRNIENTDFSGYVSIYEPTKDCHWNRVDELSVTSSPIETDYGFLLRFARTIAISKNHIMVSAEFDDDSEPFDERLQVGLVYFYERGVDGQWKESGHISSSAHRGTFGIALAIDGDRAVIGSFGAAWIYEFGESDQWKEVVKLETPDVLGIRGFGAKVALTGDRVIVSGYSDDANGAVYIYEAGEDDLWDNRTRLVPSDSEKFTQDDDFGDIVAIYGKYAAVGLDSSERESIYVFQRESIGTWSEVAILAGHDAGSLGNTLAIYKDTIISVGEDDENIKEPRSQKVVTEEGEEMTLVSVDSGPQPQVLVHQPDKQSIWNTVSTLPTLAGKDVHMDTFGNTLALSSNRLIVGAMSENAVYVFNYSELGDTSSVNFEICNSIHSFP